MSLTIDLMNALLMICIGDWKDGLRHGNGVYYCTNGEKYDGEWQNGRKHGKGVIRWSNGKCRAGKYVK